MLDRQKTEPLDPGAQQLLEKLVAAKLPDFATVPIGEARRLARELRLPWNRGGPAMAVSRDGELAGLRYRMHRPRKAGGASPVILFLHGGGWTLLGIDTHDRMSRTIAAASGATVLTIDYPLAPESPFPGALNRLDAFVDALGEKSDDLVIDPLRFALVGDSAGANLAVALTLKLRERKVRLPRGLGLLYGAYDCDLGRPSYGLYGDGSLPLSKARMQWFWENYAPDKATRKAPLVSPIHADLRGLPPSFLAVADHDVLYDENIAFAEQLREAGSVAELHVYPGTIHGFAEADGAVGAAIAGRALREVAAFLATQLAA